MLIEFKFENYRSFRDEAVLSMEAAGLGTFKGCLIPFHNLKLLPGAAVYGKNGGGKSNVIRAFWLAVQFIRNAQRTQHENAEIPVTPFALNDYSSEEPTSFEFTYIKNQIKYIYGFSASRNQIVKEYLYHAPKGQKAIVFLREGQNFTFTEDKQRRNLISETIAPNQLFFSVACTMNDSVCVEAMRWFRDDILFSRDYSDIPSQLLSYSNDPNMLKAISSYAKAADLGIEDIQYELNKSELSDEDELLKDMPEELRSAFTEFLHTLAETSNNSEIHLQKGQVTANTFHKGTTRAGEANTFALDLSDESDGTRKLMALAPAIESVLSRGGVLLVDELERELHPILVNYIISKFQNSHVNSHGAQIIFTTHNTELLNMDYLRKDQIYFVDKNKSDGVSELYSISDFSTKTSENIRKGYLAGKYGGSPDIEIEEVE